MNGKLFFTHKNWKRASVALGLAAGLVALTTLTVLISGCGEEAPPSMPVEENETSSLSISGLSLDQSKTVEELGYPDHFFISIDPLNSDRVERWIYFSKIKALDFDNGRLFGEEAIEDESAQYPPTDLRPQDFNPLMTPAEASEMLGGPIYTHQVEDSLMPENTIVVFDKAVLLYRDGQLIGADTQVRPPNIPTPQSGGMQ